MRPDSVLSPFLGAGDKIPAWGQICPREDKMGTKQPEAGQGAVPGNMEKKIVPLTALSSCLMMDVLKPVAERPGGQNDYQGTNGDKFVPALRPVIERPGDKMTVRGQIFKYRGQNEKCLEASQRAARGQISHFVPILLYY